MDGHSLRKLARAGWLVVHGVRLRQYGDIDHVAIGPGGVLVVETKWSGDPWDESSFARDRLVAACRQVGENARDVWNQLGRPAPVKAVVVLWAVGVGDVPDEARVHEVEGVSVVIGPALEEWARGLPATMDAPGQARAKTALERHVRRRDITDAVTEQPVPRSVSDLLSVLGTCVIGFVAGIVLPTLLFELVSSILAGLALATVLVGVGLLARTVRSTRPTGTAMVLGAGIVILFTAAVYAYAYGRMLLT